MYSAELYNRLVSVQEADKKFVNRSEIFARVMPILAEHGNEFGMCLVHRHCKLEDGEKMVSMGDISKPMRDMQCYPERWLANGSGDPYEFSRDSTRSPPAKLMDDFRRAVRGIDVLGIFYRGAGAYSEDAGYITLEKTVGRENITKKIPAVECPPDNIPTNWIPGRDGNGNYIPFIIGACVNGDHPGCDYW